ncbi:MAG: glycosyltransferase, partial [Gammaproteobacteria bacterium]
MSPIPNKPEGNDALSEDDVVMLLSARHAKILEPLRAIGRVPAYVTIPSDLDNGASALLKALFSLIRELRKRPRAAVFTDTADRLGMLAWLAALLMRRKLIYRSRGDVVRENMLTRSWGRYLFNRYLFFRRLSGLIPCSDYLGEVARLDFPGLAPSRIRTVNLPRPQGKTAEKLLPAEERKRWIIIASKFHFIDKIQPLQSILPQIHAFITQNPEFRCVVLGDGQHLDVIKDQCASLNMHDMVDFLGYVPNPEEYFARGLCLLHISDLDGYPSVIDEARLNNLPVICNDA